MKHLKRIFNHRNVLASCIAALFLTANVIAQVVHVSDARKQFSPQSKSTYLDLIKKVFPDGKGFNVTVAEEGKPNRNEFSIEAAHSVPLGNLFGRFQNREFEGLMQIENLETMRVMATGGERLVLLMTIFPIYEMNAIPVREDGLPKKTPEPEPEEKKGNADYINVLALFSLGAKPALLDAVDVNKSEGFSEISLSEISPNLRVRTQQDAFFIINLQRESTRNTYFYTMLTTDGDRLKLLSETPLTLVDTATCAAKSESLGTFYTGKAAVKNGYRSIYVENVTEFKNFAADCKKLVSRSKAIKGYDLIWNPERQTYDLMNEKTREVKTFPAKKAKRKV